MKKYVVVSVVSDLFKPIVEEQFDIPEDAEKYAEIMNRTNPKRQYHVYTLKEGK